MTWRTGLWKAHQTLFFLAVQKKIVIVKPKSNMNAI